MPKEWTGPSEYFAAGKAVFRSVLPPEGHSRAFNAMEFEEAADLSLKKTKPTSYETREKVYPSSYSLDETMDLSTKWRAPPTSERKPLSSISSTLAQPASTSNTSESGNPERTSEHKRSKSSHHVRMLPRKRLHTTTETHHNSASSCSSPDVIVLSDEERPRLNGHLNGYDSDAKNSDSEMPPLPPEKHWDPKELKEKMRQYKQFRGELRSEEMKLVLLKKLQQSQMIKENILNQAAAAVANKIVPTGSRSASNTAPPPPLVRTGQIPQPQNKMLGQQLSHQTSMMSSPLAAAKLALRKQLEKTLLQIPPPKPPPPEMHFVPNANNQEFICLLGLEKVVDFITEDPNINRPPPEPFECVQCGTDFSPVWKWQDAGRSRMHKPSVICETCVTSNIKKALKAEHTNRLKTAFVKALQQEQEIEQRMSQAMPSPPPPIGISPTHTPCSTPTPAIVTSSGTSSIPTPPAPHSPVHGLLSKMGNNSGTSSNQALVNSANLLQHLPKLSAAHQSLLHAQAQQLQHFAQTMQPQPQPAHMYPFAPLLAAQAYSYQLLGKNPMSSAELQRQYLLDMIPPRSLPQGKDTEFMYFDGRVGMQ
ncbi:Transcriptional repressor p66-beta like protein [Argiope bruennichi]|uniref:Transcriptional repressor p66-beta like protein n=1 Tax=Argiope bruennichi TaxID=94029 RepID=A0A8T0EDS2_ARGBR|nr:Transcriptional repressor p66-beta like protein [Argiope bruennichi]